MSLYDPFSRKNLNENEHFIVVNCLIHMLDEKSIHIDDFERFIMNDGIAGDIDWGIEKWNIYSEQDHGIKDRFDGYLFFRGADEHGDVEKGELQVILTIEEIKPYIEDIVGWYKNIPNSNVDAFVKIAQKNGFYDQF